MINNSFYLNGISVNGGIVHYHYKVCGEWKTVFHSETLFEVIYGCDVSKVPLSILMIPILSNILPIAWIFDADIHFQLIDEDFYNSIELFKAGYKSMYPGMEFKGRIHVDEIVRCDNKGVNTGVLFSGGVDAYNTLINHIEEKPTLMTMWGADIPISDCEGWDTKERQIKAVAQEYSLDLIVIKSTFRIFIDEQKLNGVVVKQSGDDWWHGFQHGIGLLSLAAPIAYIKDFKTVYIASSFTKEDKGSVTCASDPSIDNFVEYCGTRVVHDGYDQNRSQKIESICNYSNVNEKVIKPHVCWENTSGTNCCKCEKCYRTILGIMSTKNDPRRFGFNLDRKKYLYMIFDLITRINVRRNFRRYKVIQDSFKKNYDFNEMPKGLRWFYRIDFSKPENTGVERIMLKTRLLITKSKATILRFIKK